jgi:iron uptake system component EfeO
VLTDATLGQPASAEVAPYNLVAPVAEYKIYDSENAQYLVTSTRAFTER